MVKPLDVHTLIRAVIALDNVAADFDPLQDTSKDVSN
jgi:hypothetical protein